MENHSFLTTKLISCFVPLVDRLPSAFQKHGALAKVSRCYGLRVPLHVPSSKLAMNYLSSPTPTRHSAVPAMLLGLLTQLSSLLEALCHLAPGCLPEARASFVPAPGMTSQLSARPASSYCSSGEALIPVQHWNQWQFKGKESVSGNTDGDSSVKGQIWEKKQKAMLGTPHPREPVLLGTRVGSAPLLCG